jgi:hypothetical protein
MQPLLSIVVGLGTNNDYFGCMKAFFSYALVFSFLILIAISHGIANIEWVAIHGCPLEKWRNACDQSFTRRCKTKKHCRIFMLSM